MNLDFKLEPFIGDYQLIGDSQLVRLSEKFLNCTRKDGRCIGLCISGQTISELHYAIVENIYPVSSKIICLIGTNDITRESPVKAMVSSMNSLVQLLLYERSVEKLILLTVPPVPKLACYKSHWSRLKNFNDYLQTLSDGDRIIVYGIHELFLSKNHRVPRLNNATGSSSVRPPIRTAIQEKLLLDQADLLYPKFEKVTMPSYDESPKHQADSESGPLKRNVHSESNPYKPVEEEVRRVREILNPNFSIRENISSNDGCEIKVKKGEDLVHPKLLESKSLFTRRSDAQHTLSIQADLKIPNLPQEQKHGTYVTSSSKPQKLDRSSFEKSDQSRKESTQPEQKRDPLSSNENAVSEKSDTDAGKPASLVGRRPVEGMESDEKKSSFSVIGKPAERQTRPVKLLRSPLNVMLNHLNVVKLPKIKPDIGTPISVSLAQVVTVPAVKTLDSDKNNSNVKDSHSDSSGEFYTKDSKVLKVHEELSISEHSASAKSKVGKKAKTTKDRVRKQAGHFEPKIISKEIIACSNEEEVKEECCIAATSDFSLDSEAEQLDSARTEAPLLIDSGRKVFISKKSSDGGHGPIRNDQVEKRVYPSQQSSWKEDVVVSPLRSNTLTSEVERSVVISSFETPVTHYDTSMYRKCHSDLNNVQNLDPSNPHHVYREMSSTENILFVNRRIVQENLFERRVSNGRRSTPDGPKLNNDHHVGRNNYSNANWATRSPPAYSENQPDEKKIFSNNGSRSQVPFFDSQANQWIHPTISSMKSGSSVSCVAYMSRNDSVLSSMLASNGESVSNVNCGEQSSIRNYNLFPAQDSGRNFYPESKPIPVLEPSHVNQMRGKFPVTTYSPAVESSLQFARPPPNMSQFVSRPVMRPERFQSIQPVYAPMDSRIQTEPSYLPQRNTEFIAYASNVHPFILRSGQPSNFNQAEGSPQRYNRAPEISSGSYLQQIPMTPNLLQSVSNTVNGVSSQDSFRPQSPVLQHVPNELAYGGNLIFVDNNMSIPACASPERGIGRDVYDSTEWSRNAAPSIPSSYSDCSSPCPTIHNSPTYMNLLHRNGQTPSSTQPLSITDSENIEMTSLTESDTHFYVKTDSAEGSKNQGCGAIQSLNEEFERIIDVSVCVKMNSAEGSKDQDDGARQFLNEEFERSVEIDSNDPYEKLDTDDESIYESCAGDLSQDSLNSSEAQVSLSMPRNCKDTPLEHYSESSFVRDCGEPWRNREGDPSHRKFQSAADHRSPSSVSNLNHETATQPKDSSAVFKKPEVMRQKFNTTRIVRLKRRPDECIPIKCEEEDDDGSSNYYNTVKEGKYGHQRHDGEDDMISEHERHSGEEMRMPEKDDTHWREESSVKEQIVIEDDPPDELPISKNRSIEGQTRDENLSEDFEDISDEDFDFPERYEPTVQQKNFSLERRSSRTRRCSERAGKQTRSIRTSNRYSILSSESHQGPESLNWRTRSTSRCSSSSEDSLTRKMNNWQRSKKRHSDSLSNSFESRNSHMRSKSTPRFSQRKERNWTTSRDSSPARSERYQTYRDHYPHPEIKMDSFERFFNPDQENARTDLIHLNNKGLATVLDFLKEKLSQ